MLFMFFMVDFSLVLAWQQSGLVQVMTYALAWRMPNFLQDLEQN